MEEKLILKKFIILPILTILFCFSFSESIAQQETIQNITGEATITKSTVPAPSIPTGEPFSYKINFKI